MTKDLDIMEGDLETGRYMEQCGYRVPVDITYALTRQASGENCDGDPYESMVFAARYIQHLRKKIETIAACLEAGKTDTTETVADLRALIHDAK